MTTRASGTSRRIVGVIVGVIILSLGVAIQAVAHPEGPAHHAPHPPHATEVMNAFAADQQEPASLSAQGAATCTGGLAGGYPCSNVDLLAFLPLSDIGGTRSNSAANDIWGWTDPATGGEYAIIGRVFGTSFIDITDPQNPVYLGELPTHGAFGSSWRDIKVHADHAFIVSEALNHGMQVFDLTQLTTMDRSSLPVTFSETAHYSGNASAHNIVINEDSGYAYIVGASGKNSCNGGLHMVDITTPTSPSFAGCFGDDGYTHDAQCVIYAGPDSDHHGREICFNSNEDTVTIVDVTDRSAPVMLARVPYDGAEYTHQGWLTGDQRYFLVDDELDEDRHGHSTRTYVWDMADLDAPKLTGHFDGTTPAIDHNQYVKGDFSYQANYRAGLRILQLHDPSVPTLEEVAYFDVYPGDDAAEFNGAWSNYPYFDSGVVIVSGIEQGLFILLPNLPTGGGDAPPSVNITAPEAGATVSGTVTVTADASDDVGVDQVEFAVDGVSIGTDTDGTDGWSATWDTTAGSDGGHTVTAEATDTAGQTASDQITVTVDNEPDPSMHVGDLDAATGLVQGGHWDATVTITVHDDNHAAVSGATVTGTWSTGETASCETASDGTCRVTLSRIHRNTAEVTFTVDGITHASSVYDSGPNHDPDGESNGTSITVTKP